MISRSVDSVPLPIDDAFNLLKRLALPYGSPPNFTMSGGEDEELQRREQEHIRALSQSFDRPQMSTENPEISTINPLSPGFFAGHAHERLTDRERTVDDNEEQEVRSRITEAMQPYIDSMGNYKMDAPKHIAIRTHILNGHRQPDESYAKSNGDSIVGIVRPHPKNKLKPRLETSMLRRTEFSNAPQPFKADALRVDKVVNAHGMSKKGLKRMMARRKAMAKGDPMGIAFLLLKERKSPEAMRRKKEYDTKYESSPERVKYREELNRERKRRGIYGSHDHMDVSHTQGGRLTLEGEHANRARHFKNRGTLRRVRVR